MNGTILLHNFMKISSLLSAVRFVYSPLRISPSFGEKLRSKVNKKLSSVVQICRRGMSNSLLLISTVLDFSDLKFLKTCSIQSIHQYTETIQATFEKLN